MFSFIIATEKKITKLCQNELFLEHWQLTKASFWSGFVQLKKKWSNLGQNIEFVLFPFFSLQLHSSLK